MDTCTSKREVKGFAVLLVFTYMVSYITRTNFGAIVSEISVCTGFSKSLLAMSLTGSFITYGSGQIISGILGDRLSPKRLVSLGLALTGGMNLLLPLCRNPYQMLVVWCINGFAQAFIWPPMVRMMTELLSEDDYKQTATKVNWGGSFGTIAVYLLSPVIITIAGWKALFLVSALAGVVMLLIWDRKAVELQPSRKQDIQKMENEKARTLWDPTMLCILAAIVLQGMLRDGISTWMPSLIAESFQLDRTVSILTGVLLPVFAIGSLQVTNGIYRRKGIHPIACAALLFTAGAVFAILLWVFCGKSVVMSVILTALLTGCMHGVNLMLVSMLPRYFRRYGNTAMVSGVLNACTYVGSAVSTYGIALLSEKVGWRGTVFLWFLIALAGDVICLCCIRPWHQRFEDKGAST